VQVAKRFRCCCAHHNKSRRTAVVLVASRPVRAAAWSRFSPLSLTADLSRPASSRFSSRSTLRWNLSALVRFFGHAYSLARTCRCLVAATPFAANLIWPSANLFSGTLSRQSLLLSPLLARLQVVGMTLHFLNDVFRLNLALEPTQGILQRFAVMQSNFCQTDHPQTKIN